VNIEFITVCYNFQHRLSWFLSSLVQQTYRPDVTINLAYIRDNGTPTTEEIIEFYKKDGIKFRTMCFENVEDIAYRGTLRNAQIALSRGEWIYFYDCDQVLPKDYFEKWKNILNNDDCIFYEKQKLFTVPEDTKRLMDISPKWIDDAYDKADKLPKLDISTRGVASGGMLMMRRSLIYKVTKGLYSNSETRKDRHFFRQRTFSDPIFRRKFAVKGFAIAPIIHLGHCRWKDYKSGKIIQQ
jgi:GT2 family glycosyltransferase